MGTLKSCASRALNDAFGNRRKRWSRHGSTRWLWESEHMTAAVAYVLQQQGRPMEAYVDAQWVANLDQAAQQQSRGREPAVKAANDRALRRFRGCRGSRPHPCGRGPGGVLGVALAPS